MRDTVWPALLAASISLSCTERELSRDRASALIAPLDGFKQVPHFWLRTGVAFRSAFSCDDQAEVERDPLNQLLANKLGWVRYETRPTIVGIRITEDCPVMALTSAGEAASTGWTQAQSQSAGEASWAVPIGVRELVQVTGLTGAPDGSTMAEFDWRWSPNKIGNILRDAVPKARDFFDSTKKSRATCRRSDDGWRCELGMWTNRADALGEFSTR